MILTSSRQDSLDVALCMMIVAACGTDVPIKLRAIDIQRFVRDTPNSVFNGAVYSDCGPEPFCPKLEETFNRLVASGFFSYPDVQDPSLITAKPAARAYAAQRRDEFSVEEVMEILAMSHMLVEKFGPSAESDRA